MKTKKTIFAVVLTACIMFMLTAITTQSQIQFQGLGIDHEGTAVWDADGSGPEPAASGHIIPLSGFTNQPYYGASRDYVDSNPDAAGFHLQDIISEFPMFVQALADNGFTPGQVKVKFGLCSLEEDIEGIDWLITGDMYHTNYYNLGYQFIVNEEPMISGLIGYLNTSINASGGIWFCEYSFTKPTDASGSSSAGVQEVAIAFLQDLAGDEMHVSHQVATEEYFSGTNGRDGRYMNVTNGIIQKGLPTIPFHGLPADHEGAAAWNTNGTGPEPLRNGHSATYYYGASRDYDDIDPNPNAAFGHFLDNSEGFTNFLLQLEYRGYSLDQVKIKAGICGQDEDIEGEDWQIDTLGIHHLNEYHSHCTVELDGEALLGFMVDTAFFIHESNWNITSSPAVVYDASENSSADVQFVAQAFLKDLEIRQLQMDYSLSYLQTFNDNGRSGTFFQVNNGHMVAKESICTRVYAGNVSGTWTASCSPYIIEGEINVPAGEALVIEPGVWVKFMDLYSVNVLGSVAANGLATNTGGVVFTAVNPEKGWDGFDMYNTSNSESVIFNNCIFEYGFANGVDGFCSGGAIAVASFDNITIDHCIFRNNWATLEMGDYKGSGGAIALDNSSITISNSEFYNNYAKFVGGAVVCYGGSNTNIDHCLFHHNASGQDAGAIEIWTSSPTITNCTFSNNNATSWGGAFDIYDFSAPIIKNCIFWDNTAGQYDQISIYSGDCTVAINYSDVEGGQFGMGPYGIGANGSYENNIEENPVFVGLLAWDFNLDLSLSPCIDAGDPSMPDPDGTAPEMGCYYYPQVGILTNLTDDLQLYPNPASSQISIENAWLDASDVKIEVLNFLGQKMNEFTLLSSAYKEIQIDISSYPSGSYFCKLTNGNKVHTTKFIKY